MQKEGHAMKNHEERTTVRVDWYTRACLTAISVLLTVLVIGLWADTPVISTDRAGAADGSGYVNKQAKEAVLEGRWGTASAAGKVAAVQSDTNKRLEELIQMLRKGEARVQVVSMPDSGAGVTKSVPRTDE
jgi:hypothetical protein